MWPPQIQAAFETNTDEVCDGGEVIFTDQSVGNITSWAWTFEGGTPSTSNNQNPVIAYETPGEYDVELVVSDGTNSNTLNAANFILVETLPTANAGYNGETCIDQALMISGAQVENSETLLWEISSGDGYLTDEQTLTPTYTPAETDAGTTVGLVLSAYGIGGCGDETATSETDIIVNALPNVVLDNFGEVCIDWEPFELTGGSPANGEYTGNGVTDGIFNPMAAGIGVHTITYTYVDDNECVNFAVAEITVTTCVGIDEDKYAGITLFPNPSGGIFNITTGTDETKNIEVVSPNGRIAKKLQIETSGTIDLQDQANGIYYIRISGSDKQEIIKLILIRE